VFVCVCLRICRLSVCVCDLVFFVCVCDLFLFVQVGVQLRHAATVTSPLLYFTPDCRTSQNGDRWNRLRAEGQVRCALSALDQLSKKRRRGQTGISGLGFRVNPLTNWS